MIDFFSPLPPVAHDSEFERILNLPRREWTQTAMLQAAELLSPQLLNDRGKAEWGRLLTLPHEQREAEFTRFASKPEKGGEGCPLRLNPLQAVALPEAHYVRGLFGGLNVGRGKTLLCWLLPFFFPEITCSALILPGGLKTSKASSRLGKTEIEFAMIRKFWKTPDFPVHLVGYEFLARKEQAGYLCDCPACLDPKDKEELDRKAAERGETRIVLRPGLVIADESDMFKNPKAGRTKRVLRYISNHPEVVFICLTGTWIESGLRDFAHLMILALKQNAPIPLLWHVLESWCQAYDFEPKDGIRRRPGALKKLAKDVVRDDSTMTEIELVREGVLERLRATPGVILDDASSCDLPITIRPIKPPDDPVLEKAFFDFRSTGLTPDGLDVSGNLDRALHGSQLGSGWYNLHDPPPPEEWLLKRRAFHKAIRTAIDDSESRGRPIDTAEQAAIALKNHPTVIEWREIEKSYIPDPKATWISMSVMAFVAEWIRLNSPALIWTQDVAVGNALESLTGVSYYREQGMNKAKQLIDNADVRQSAIVSIGSNKRGRNLFGWNRALSVRPPAHPTDWEQCILGRMHRTGQLLPVFVDVVVTSADSLYALERACDKSRFIASARRAQPKLLQANFDWSVFPAYELSTLSENDPRKARWTRRGVQPDALT